MTWQKLILSLAAGAGVVVTASRWRKSDRAPRHPVANGATSNRDSTSIWTRVPVFSGDRFGDTWGRF